MGVNLETSLKQDFNPKYIEIGNNLEEIIAVYCVIINMSRFAVVLGVFFLSQKEDTAPPANHL